MLSAAEGKRMLRHLKAEGQKANKEAKLHVNARARGSAREYEEILKERYGHDPSFFKYDPNRALNLQDFDYTFCHRGMLADIKQSWLEIAATKLTYVNSDGKNGYFNDLENNVGWTRHITPFIHMPFPDFDKIIRCGLWANAKNSRRCHKGDQCSLCHWVDTLKVLVEAFGTNSGAFAKAPAWYFFTTGFTTNPHNSKAQVKGFDPAQTYADGQDVSYDAFPVPLGDREHEIWQGYDDARVLALILQGAIEKLYHAGFVHGYRHKFEGAYRLGPCNRMNMHAHCVANSSDTNPQFFADRLFDLIRDGLDRHRSRLTREYHPDVQVNRLANAVELENSIKYSEKIIAIDEIVAEAMSRPEAKLEDGTWNPAHYRNVTWWLYNLVHDDIPNIFQSIRIDREFFNLRRRKTVGNMMFNDNETCIGREPSWHKIKRRKAAKVTRKSREEKKKREAEAVAAGAPLRPRRRQTRTLKNPRRLGRSLKQAAKSTTVVTNGAARRSATQATITRMLAQIRTHRESQRARPLRRETEPNIYEDEY